VPTAWRTIEQLPLTGNGKVDRKALLQTPLDTTGEADRFSSGTETVQRREFVAPSNSLESSLQAIWERILGTFRIGVTDDFFELGGQSFDAIRIFALIKEEFGKGHTLSDMWRARTIRGLAKGIAGGEESGGGGSVVPIDLRGRGEALFLVHPAGGSVMTYSRLGRLIDRPLYGIQASTSVKDVSHRRDIIELAGRYVADVREIQMNGPYSLGGWSSGAMIAFEMAAQLEAAGEQVTQVYILDGPVPVGHGELNDERLLLWFLDDLALGLPLERLRDQNFSGQTLEEQLLTAETLLEVGNGAKIDLKPLLANFQIFRDLIVAGSRYVPKTISADLTVVRVAEDIVDEFSTHPHRNESDWGWRGFTRGQVRCARVPGTHHSFLTEPLVDGWCALLSEVEPSAVGRM
jgi:pyochelin synthetase